jgi:transcriptional regulator with XRE-family HTH domain
VDKSPFSPLYEAVKAKLIALRTAAGLTQRALAARLGRDHTLITRLEQGERRLDVLELYLVCKACGVKADEAGAQLLREIRKLDKKPRKAAPKRRAKRG